MYIGTIQGIHRGYPPVRVPAMLNMFASNLHLRPPLQQESVCFVKQVLNPKP